MVRSVLRKKGMALSLDAVAGILVILILTSTVCIKGPSILNAGRTSRAQSDTASLGGYISEYKMEIGSYPDSLAALKQANGQYEPWITTLPTDPWGNSYQYKKTDNKFVVYSLGPDGTDSGSSAENGIANNDIGFFGK